MPCSAKFSMSLQTEIHSTEISDFLKQIFSLKSFNLVLEIVAFFTCGAKTKDLMIMRP